MRSKLIEARERRGWTQEVAAQHLGIDRATLQRWEYGQSRPRGYSKKRLCDVYEADAYALGLEGIGAAERESAAPLLLGSNFLETKLLTHIIQWPRNSMNYIELLRGLRKEIQTDMSSEITRRQVLEVMAVLPCTALGLSSSEASLGHPEETMPWITGGIVGCWGLGRGSDLTLASQLVSTYIPTLTLYVKQPHYRKAAASLAAQAWLLKTTLGWHCETLPNALQYALEAEKYAKISGESTLQVDAMHRLGMAHFYAKRYDKALEKLEEAKEIIEHNGAVPHTVARHAYLDLAAYQAKSGNADETKKTLKKAYKLFNATSDDPMAQMLGYSDIENVLRWEGLALSYMGDHSAALDSYKQVADARGVAERIYVEVLLNRLNSKLRLPNKELGECITLWTTAIEGAKDLQSEQRYNEAIALYETMECIWPGESCIVELRPLIVHW
jgi:tetratricopeptide (TPR) repeat protein/transcriptional regulator with XRE-family HTH domain